VVKSASASSASIELEYDVQICASQHVGDTVVGSDQFEIAAAVPRRDEKSNQSTDLPLSM
jgi:hypothetical protein